MPLYTYECRDHGEFNLLLPLEDFKIIVPCPDCRMMCKQVIVPGHGGIQCDSAVDVPWLASACKTLLPDDHKPLETRGEYKRYLKEHRIEARG